MMGVGAKVALDNVTIADNTATKEGGGVGYFDAIAKPTPELQLANSIVAGNTAGTGSDCNALGKKQNGSVVGKGFNLIGDTSGCAVTTKKTDLVNQTANLGALQLSGMCTAATRAPQGGSPALLAGSPGKPSGKVGSAGSHCLPVDECGAARPKDKCDIGAVQVSS